MVAIEDAPQTISVDREELDKQREAKRKKEEMIEKKSLEKAVETLVEASYYWGMYFSDVCWKGKQSIATKMLALLKSESAKLGYKRKYPNVSDWIEMEAIFNYVVTQRHEEICGWAGNAFEVDYQGRKEINSSNSFSSRNAKACKAPYTWDRNTAAIGKQWHCIDWWEEI
jgi:hypothetical protein